MTADAFSLNGTANQRFPPKTANPADSLPSPGVLDSRVHNATSARRILRFAIRDRRNPFASAGRQCRSGAAFLKAYSLRISSMQIAGPPDPRTQQKREDG